jgi:hypothetical protein
MIKRIFDGLLFGFGFAIAYIIIWSIWTYFVLPHTFGTFPSTYVATQPKFEKPKEAKVLVPDTTLIAENQDFNLIKGAGEQMKIPNGGGILAMSIVATAKGSKRPSTYQLWLTKNKLWQIRTTEDKTEIEEIQYPKNATDSGLDELMYEALGTYAQNATMTVDADEINQLKSSGNLHCNESLNGKLKITANGVVFVLPNPY